MNNNCNWALWGLPRTNCPPWISPSSCFLHHRAMGQQHLVGGKHLGLSLRQRCSGCCWTESKSCHWPGANVPWWGAHSGLPSHMGCQNCYPAKLGSLHPQAVKPIYWQEAVAKERVLFMAGRQARSSGLLNISCLNSAWRPAINATLFFITTQCQ